MKTIIVTLAAYCLASQALMAETTWLDSVPDAMAKATSENKMVLLDFTGSDWCGWCKKLAAETLSKQEFMDYASKNLVLVEVDFPMHTSQPAELKAANAALKKKYEVRGYPTLVVLKADGTVLWKQTGYLAGGPSAMIAALDKVNPNPKPATPAAPALVAVPTAPAPVVVLQKAPPEPSKHGDLPKVQGIFYSATRPSAVLNGNLCWIGDSVAGVKVVKITEDKVTVERDGQTLDLFMNN